MSIGWTGAYETRRGAFSLRVHRARFDGLAGEKVELTSREAIAALRG